MIDRFWGDMKVAAEGGNVPDNHDGEGRRRAF